MNIFNLFTWEYWFSQPYIAYGHTKWIWLIIFLAFILFGLVSKIWEVARVDGVLKRVWHSLANSFFCTGLLGLLWMFFRQQHVPFLAWRFWLLIIFIGVVWRQYYNFKFVFKRYPKIKMEQAERAVKEKYLP